MKGGSPLPDAAAFCFLVRLPARAAVRDALLASGWPLAAGGSYLFARLAFYGVSTGAVPAAG